MYFYCTYAVPKTDWLAARPMIYAGGAGTRVARTSGVHTLRAEDLHVQMSEPAGDGEGELGHPGEGYGAPVEVVEQRAVLVVVGDEPQLSPGAVVCDTTPSTPSTPPLQTARLHALIGIKNDYRSLIAQTDYLNSVIRLKMINESLQIMSSNLIRGGQSLVVSCKDRGHHLLKTKNS